MELELHVPERRLRHILAAQEQAEGKSDYSRPTLDVTFMLSSHAGEEYDGRVIEIEQSAEVRGEEGNTILVRVEVDRDAAALARSDDRHRQALLRQRKSLGLHVVLRLD